MEARTQYPPLLPLRQVLLHRVPHVVRIGIILLCRRQLDAGVARWGPAAGAVSFPIAAAGADLRLGLPCGR